MTTVSISITDTPPVAVDDTASTDEDTAVAISVLANDTDADNDPLTVVGASDGIYGTTVVNGDGTVTYTPNAGFSGTDSFVYAIDDGYGNIAYATVTVTVNHVNHPPIAVNDGATVYMDTSGSIDVLANDSDPDNDPLSVIAVTQGRTEQSASPRAALFTLPQRATRAWIRSHTPSAMAREEPRRPP